MEHQNDRVDDLTHVKAGEPPLGKPQGSPRVVKKGSWSIRASIVLGLVCSIPLLGCWLWASVNPARQSDQMIRGELLNATPLGSSEDFVNRYAMSRFARDNFFQWVSKGDGEGKLLMLCYGCYTTFENFPFSTCVQASWHFDNDGKLVSIGVSKWVDCP